jgi:hypothetical protein
MKRVRKSAKPEARRECISSSFDLPQVVTIGRALCELSHFWLHFAALAT